MKSFPAGNKIEKFKERRIAYFVKRTSFAFSV